MNVLIFLYMADAST